MKVKNGSESCECIQADKIVVACSGACDLGEITDIVARRLRTNGVYKMNCLAAVGAGIKTTIEAFQVAEVLVLDGCAVNCGKKMFDSAGIQDYSYLRLTDLGYSKGKTPVETSALDAIYEAVLQI